MATQASLNTIQSMYVAYYGRPADPAGLEFWATALDQSQGNLASIINAFGTSSEYTNRFGNNTPEQAINNLYQQLFGRDAEPEGLSFHLDLLNSGLKTLAELAMQIALGAQGGDRTVLEGRTQVANAFTRELDTAEEIAAYSSDRGVLIGQNYLKLVTESNPASVVLRDAAPVVKTLLPDTGPVTPPGGGGGTTPPAPTFTATLDINGEVVFGGTQTGDITLASEGGIWTFTRGALSASIWAEDVTGIALGAANISMSAELLDGKTVTGTGQLTLSNLTPEVNLSGLAESLNVIASIATNLDISENANLSSVDVYQVANGAELTMTLDHYNNAQLQGLGTLKLAGDIADKITINYPDGTLESVTLTLNSNTLGSVTVADIQALLALSNVLDEDSDPIELDNLVYQLTDTSAALSSTVEGVEAIVQYATSVTASDDATVAQARTIYTRNDSATYSITDSSSAILSTVDGTAAALTQATKITVSNTLSVSTATEIHTLGISVSTTTLYNVSDTYANIIAGNPAVINGAQNLTNNTSLTDIEQAQALIDFTNSGVTDVGYLVDTVADINTFIARAGNERSDDLLYNFNVRDSAAHILAAIDATNLLFITGKPADGFEGDTLVGLIEVTDSFNVEGAEEFWDAVNDIFVANETTTAEKTDYVVQDYILEYTNEMTGHGSIVDADLRVITGSAEEIHQAQRGTLTDNRDIFDLLSGSDYLIVSGSAGEQTIVGGPGSDTIYVGEGNDTVYGGTGSDTINGGDGFDTLYGEDDRDTIYAGANAADTTASSNDWWQYNTVVGGQGGDRMFGSTQADLFIYEGSSRAELIAESGTTSSSRDYISNFSLGDRILFNHIDSVQFFSSGSANANNVEAGSLGLSIRYEKNATVLDWNGTATQTASRIFIDIADENGQFDDIADMHIILVGSGIDINWDGSYLTFGG